MRLTVRQVVEETGVPERTLRHYRSAGLFPDDPLDVEPGYSLFQVLALKSIPRLRAQGHRSLEALRRKLASMSLEDVAVSAGIDLANVRADLLPEGYVVNRAAAPPAPVSPVVAPAAAPSAPSADHFRRLEAMYLAAPINRIYRPTVAVHEGRCEIVSEARPALHHAAGAVHGSVLFKMLDDAAFFAVASLVPDVFVLTASFHLAFLRPVVEGPMRAVGRVIRPSRTLTYAEAVVTGPDGRELARGAGDFVRSAIPLGPAVGYGADPSPGDRS